MRDVIAFWSRSSISGTLAFSFTAIAVVVVVLSVPSGGPGVLGLLAPVAVLGGAGFALRA